MIGNPRYGVVGMLALPFYLIVEAAGPCVEFFGYVVFGLSLAFRLVDASFVVVFLSVSVLAGTLLSMSAILLEEMTLRRYTHVADLPGLLWICVAENFGYRQLHAYWRLRGIIRFLRGKHDWGQMTRRGFQPSTITSAAERTP